MEQQSSTEGLAEQQPPGPWAGFNAGDEVLHALEGDVQGVQAGDDQGEPGSQPEQQEVSQQQQQQQQVLQQPDIPTFSGGADDEELDMETAHEKFQARVKASVTRDIKRMLLNSKAYVKHYSRPPTISTVQLKALSQPKPNLMHVETALARSAGDPGEYARRKAQQLKQGREKSERQAQVDADRKAAAAGQLASWQQWRSQQEALKEQRKELERQEAQRYGAQLARHVTSRAKQELQARQEKNRIAKVVAQKVHAQLAEQQFFF